MIQAETEEAKPIQPIPEVEVVDVTQLGQEFYTAKEDTHALKRM